MVYKRNKKPAHFTYAERVLGAFNQVQREHRKRSVHLATLRAQVKKNAQAKKDTLGPNWTHWVGKAVAKLENDGIFQHAGAIASVSLTPTGKKTIANARRVIKNSGETPQSHSQDDRVWKQVASLGTKRSRRQSKVGGYVSDDTEQQATPARDGTGRKRPRLSTSPEKRSRIGQAENPPLHDLLRGVSPLTDLDSEDEDLSAQRREELRDRDHEMRPELIAPERTPSNAENEADGNIRYATPPAPLDLDRPSSPISPTNRLLSRNHPGGVVRTQSGSLIPNLSKQPTPAPSSPDREDLDDTEGNLGSPNFEMDIDTFNPFASRPSHGRASPQPHLQSVGAGSVAGRAEMQLITSLKLEVKNLQQQLLNAGNVSEERTAGKAAGVEKVMSQRLQSLELSIAERDADISGLQGQNKRLQAEINEVSDELEAAESLVEERTVERDVLLGEVQTLEALNTDLVRGRADLQDALALAKAELSEAKGLNDSLQNQCDNLAVEIESLKRREAEGTSRTQSLVESLSRITNDAQVLRDQNASLELSLSKYRDEAQEKDGFVQRLLNEANVKDIYIEDLSAQLQTSKQGAEESAVRVSQQQAAIAALSEEMLSMQENVKTLEETLVTKLDELEAEKAQTVKLARQLADTERGLQAAQQAAIDASLEIGKLTSESTLKDDYIQQISMEIEVTRGHAMTAEGKLSESRETYEKERTALLAQVSDLRADLETVKGQSDALLTDMRVDHARAVEEMENRLAESQHALDVERRSKSALEAGMVSYIGKIQDLEAQLAEAENAKALDRMKMADLRKSFASLQKMFEEYEGGIIPPQPSSEERVAAPQL
ncbi:hypothetical protein M413DRAFT_279303 [Hebeloma cylindrosporum]|uniref:Uncharacterized protein n=1 Tax=Hebeloma cylindrosporum TaxID=76867 RepID=A0A0C3BYT4_HEBCY|nr:hypothetical protein M413DRAFT_279303 [Hebeloma cylindrosporum h7]